MRLLLQYTGPVLVLVERYKIRFFFCNQQILIDGSGHLLGRLASVVAKATLQGQC